MSGYSGSPNPTASALPSGINAAKIADGSVSNTEFQRLDGVTGNIQTQIDGKLPTSAITQSITNGDTTHAPSGDAVFDALAAIPPGIANSAGANVVMKSDGTNAVASQITDDGADVGVAAAANINWLATGSWAMGDPDGDALASIQGSLGNKIVGLRADSISFTLDGVATSAILNSPIIKIIGLPTSDPHNLNQLYSAAGVVMISAG